MLIKHYFQHKINLCEFDIGKSKSSIEHVIMVVPSSTYKEFYILGQPILSIVDNDLYIRNGYNNRNINSFKTRVLENKLRGIF